MKKARERKEHKPWERFTIFDIILYFFLAILTFSMLFPLWNAVVLSFNDGTDARMGGIYFWPRVFTLENYKKVIADMAVWRAFGVSVLRTLLGTFGSLLVTSLFSYAVSRRVLVFQKFYMFLLLLSMFFSAGMIPTFLAFRSLGMYNNFLVYIVPWLFNAFYAQILISFFRGIPVGLLESAKIDGAGEWTIYGRIIVPLSKPAFAAVGLFIAINHWNAWQDNMLYMKKEQWNTLSFLFVKMIRSQEYLENLASATGVSELGRASAVSSTTLQLATMMVSIVPIMCVYPFLQKHFTSGIMIGSIKG